MSSLLVGMSIKFEDNNKSFAVVLDRDDCINKKSQGKDYFFQIIDDIVKQNPEIESIIENWLHGEQE